MGQDQLVATGFSVFVLLWVTWFLVTCRSSDVTDSDRVAYWSGVILTIATGGLGVWGTLSWNLWLGPAAHFAALLVVLMGAYLAERSMGFLWSAYMGVLTVALYEAVTIGAVVWVLAVG